MSANNPIPSPPAASSFPLLNVVTVAANLLLTALNDVVLVDATTGNKTITLPSAVGISGKVFYVKKTDSSSNFVIIDANGVETIDGLLTQSTMIQYTNFTIVSDGSNWFIL